MDTCLHGICLRDDYACMRKLSGGVISPGSCFANLEKATMPKEEVPIAKVGSSSTTEKSKERSCEPNTEKEEKKVLQELA